MPPESPSPLAVDALVARFTAIWSDPPAHGYRFLDAFAEDVRLAAPLAGRSRGREAGYAAFRRTYAVLPDLTAAVDGWALAAERLYIQVRFRTRAPGWLFEWPAVDVLTLRQGLVVERTSYFDPLPIVGVLLRRPLLGLRWARTRLGRAPRAWPNGVEEP